MKHADLIIIGAGPGGYETAVLAAKSGLETILIEKQWLGGACLNEGCIPTKCLCRSAEVIDLIRESDVLLGVENTAVKYDFSKVMERKSGVVDTLKAGVDSLLKSANVSVVIGAASFKDAHTIVVENAKNQAGEEVEAEYSADNIIIATGAETKFLPIEGAHSENVLTSRELLSIDYVPQSLCIVGGGVIGLEFASVFSSFGSKVSVVEFCPEILPNFDHDMSKRLRMSLKKKGIEFHVKAAVTAIETTEDGLSKVKFTEKGKDCEISAEKVLMATGRKAFVDGLNLEAIGVETDRRGIVVDENFETSVKGIYAIGDVNGRVMLAHVAKFQGKQALAKILGKDTRIDFNIIPAAVFTSPELAMVGLTEEECKAKEISFKAYKAFYRANGKALSLNESEGLVKLLATEDGKILGSTILGAHASDLIHEVAMVMSCGGTVADIQHTIHAHPTLSEIILDASES